MRRTRRERSDELPFPLNHWYVGALRDEIGTVPFARTLLGRPVVFYRPTAQHAVAVAGRCPHRGYPMSRATVVDGGLRCGYHGLTFDETGICRSLAAHDGVAERARLRSFPVLEAGPFVWVWLGDPRLADRALLPCGAEVGFGQAGWRTDATGYVNVRARYAMLCDNLLDTSHIDCVHAGSLGRAPLTFQQTIAPSRERIGVVRESRGNAAALFTYLLPGCTGPIDVTIAAEFCGPGFIVAVRTEFAHAANGRPAERIATMAFVHAVTPESETSTHYFPAFVRDFRLDDEPFTAEMNARNLIVAREDQAAVEAIEATPGVADRAGGFSLPGDEVALVARRELARLVDREQ